MTWSSKIYKVARYHSTQTTPIYQYAGVAVT